MKMKKIRNMSKSNRAFYVFNTVFWIVIMLLTLYPLYLVCIASVSDPDAVALGKVTWKPVDISLIGYQTIMKNKSLWISYGNSLFYTGAGIVISIVITLTAAYALSRRVFPGKKIINMYILITMFISAGMIPSFLNIRSLGLYNTRMICIISGCLSVWNLMVARTFIQNSIPDELYEAAILDGASHVQYFSKVVVPLSKTIVAVLAVYYGVGKWNNYMVGLIYIKDKVKLPLQTVLRGILATLKVDMSDDFMMAVEGYAESMQQALRIANASKYCVIVITTFPVILLYIVFQKHFEKGIMIGSLKG